MGNDPDICEVLSFSTSPNLRHHLTVLNANVPNCYITPKLLVIAHTGDLSSIEGAGHFGTIWILGNSYIFDKSYLINILWNFVVIVVVVCSFVKMVFFSEEDKILIKNLRQLKGYTAVRFLREFESKNWTRSGLDYLLAKIDRSGSVDRVSGSGRHRTARAIGNVTVVDKMALSQEERLCPCTWGTLRA